MNALEKILEEIKSNIREKRKEMKLTQRQLAEKIGKSESSVRKYEKGDVEIPLSALYELSEVFRCDLKELLFGESESDGWIPVTERLPEKEGNVLVTVNGRYGSIKFENAIMLGEYDDIFKEWVIEGYPYWFNPNVTAWMPLPEAYKGE